MSIQDSEILKQQFQLIQEQQQKKLRARKQKSANNSTKATPPTSKDNWGLEDDLDLKLDIKVPDEKELHMYSKLQELKQATRVLKDENGRMYKLLGERDEEMRIIRKQRDNERKALAGTGIASDTAAGKIVELSKKNRDLSADLQSEKNKARQLAKRVQDLESQVVDQTKAVPVRTNDKGTDEETKDLQDKLKGASFKMAEYRNQCESLKKELKVANRVLSKELGEHVNVATLLNDPSGWRGRQQQISALQNKVTDLKGQLHEVARCGLTTSSNFLRLSSIPTPSSLHDDKHKSMLKKIEKDRKDTLEKTKSELDNLNEEHNKLQQKLDASKARNKVLANELKNVKAQMKTLMEKGAHDDELIAALMREQQHLKESTKKSTTQSIQPQVIVTQDTALVNHLRQSCHEQQGRIKELEQELHKTKQRLQQELTEKENTENHPRPQMADVGCSTEDLPTKPSHSFSELPTKPSHSFSEPNINRLILGANDKPTQSPSKPNVVTRRTPQSPASRNSRAGYPLPPTPPSGGRHSRGRRNSASNSEEVYVLRCQVQEVKSVSQVAEVERDRLLELVSVLQKRHDGDKSKLLDVTTKLQEQRVMNAHLEKQLGRVQTSQTFKSIHSTKNKARGSSSRFGKDSDRTRFNEELEELKVWLEIQKDENDALKEALNSTLKAKEEDLKFYQEMMEQTKKVFLQGLRQFRQNSAPS